MYAVDDRDTVVELLGVPQSSVGAPCPMVLADEHFLHLAYFVNEPADGWDGTWVKSVGIHTEDEPCALVRFEHVHAHMFGPPNDEAFSGHPLASRGLEPYAVFEVRDSPGFAPWRG